MIVLTLVNLVSSAKVSHHQGGIRQDEYHLSQKKGQKHYPEVQPDDLSLQYHAHKVDTVSSMHVCVTSHVMDCCVYMVEGFSWNGVCVN